MEGFCLMAGSTKQKKLDQSHLESAEVKRIMAEAEMYSNEEYASQSDDCSMGNEDQDQPIICMRSHWGEDITCEASSNIMIQMMLVLLLALLR